MKYPALHAFEYFSLEFQRALWEPIDNGQLNWNLLSSFPAERVFAGYATFVSSIDSGLPKRKKKQKQTFSNFQSFELKDFE